MTLCANKFVKMTEKFVKLIIATYSISPKICANLSKKFNLTEKCWFFRKNRDRFFIEHCVFLPSIWRKLWIMNQKLYFMQYALFFNFTKKLHSSVFRTLCVHNVVISEILQSFAVVRPKGLMNYKIFYMTDWGLGDTGPKEWSNLTKRGEARYWFYYPASAVSSAVNK